MAIMLPSELASLLGILGFDWPQSNEDNLMDFGQAWVDFGSELSGIAAGMGPTPSVSETPGPTGCRTGLEAVIR